MVYLKENETFVFLPYFFQEQSSKSSMTSHQKLYLCSYLFRLSSSNRKLAKNERVFQPSWILYTKSKHKKLFMGLQTLFLKKDSSEMNHKAVISHTCRKTQAFFCVCCTSKATQIILFSKSIPYGNLRSRYFQCLECLSWVQKSKATKYPQRNQPHSFTMPQF